jgi:hypothetical protein
VAICIDDTLSWVVSESNVDGVKDIEWNAAVPGFVGNSGPLLIRDVLPLDICCPAH